MERENIVIVGGTLIDGSGGKPLADSVVLIEGDRIAAVGPRDAVQIPADAEQVDAQGKYVLPGLIDLHTHMYMPMMVQGGKLSTKPRPMPPSMPQTTCGGRSRRASRRFATWGPSIT